MEEAHSTGPVFLYLVDSHISCVIGSWMLSFLDLDDVTLDLRNVKKSSEGQKNRRGEMEMQRLEREREKKETWMENII